MYFIIFLALKLHFYSALFFHFIIGGDNQQDSDFTPFLNIINEWYAKDTSKKIKAVFKAKGESGKPLATNPPYGYLKSSEDKNKWIVDETAAKVVKEIFHLCMQGYGPTQIAKELKHQKILVPTAHLRDIGVSTPVKAPENVYDWSTGSVVRILGKQEYLGHTVNFKTYTKSYKHKKKLDNDPSNWQIFENTHEAIIDEETFKTVQRIRDGKRKVNRLGEMPILSGMLFCADCGNKLYQVRGKGWEHEKEHFVCATYRKVKGGCTSHQIRNVVIEELLLDEIHSITTFARENENEFIELVAKKNKTDMDKSLREYERELSQSKNRITKLDNIIQKLYEDNVEGKISDERFMKMTANYETEQKSLETRVLELESTIADNKENALNTQHFLSLVQKYTDIKELSAELIREFVEKIYVYKAEKIDGKRVQRIGIVWNCIGEFSTPTK